MKGEDRRTVDEAEPAGDQAGPTELWTHLRPGSDGLIPAIVRDRRTGDVLMLGYQDREAFQRTLAGGDLWFYSRSRQTLWHKGETSGSFMRVVGRPLVDCDADTLLWVVDPAGPACHTGHRSCFYREMGEEGPVDAVDAKPTAGPEAQSTASTDLSAVPARLATIIAERRATAPEGSYTAKLFAAGLDKMLKKVGEEATEVVLAAKNNDRPNLIWELADLYYHVAVVMEQVGVTRDEVLGELGRRFR
ncbi:MAG TPA: bifunctional phosphoribosyl-AMP cyclohydrolase/phosphoribosyl-ATP diphosphatase HisIE [Bacillota bacterium]|jgi:phosphoribosyl-ATP pyrophosphohydrolase/phosphoribosyl-AMP cyclohydrolase